MAEAVAVTGSLEVSFCMVIFDIRTCVDILYCIGYVHLFEIVIYLQEKHPWEMSVRERIDSAKRFKDLGNEMFKAGNSLNALDNYRYGIQRIIPAYEVSEEEKQEIDPLKISFYLNIAACQIKLKNFEYAVTNCTKALEMDNNNAKALYRRSVANLELNDLDKAKEDIVAGLKIESENSAFKKQLQKLESKFEEQNRRYQNLMKGYLAEVSVEENST